MSTGSATSVLPGRLGELPRWLEGTGGFSALLQSLQAGQAATVDGAWNSSAALVAATLGLRTPSTLLIVLAHPRDLDSWDEDLLSFAGIRAVTFPAWDSLPDADTVLDEIGGRRLRVLRQLENDAPPRIILTTIQALLQPVPNREQLSRHRKRLRVKQDIAIESIVAWLVEQGFQRMEAIEIPGEFSQRGGILDVFSPDAEAPYRVEFVGNEIESIRQFSPQTQRSLGDVQAVEITAQGRNVPGNELLRGNLCDYLLTKAWTMLVELGDLEEQGKAYLERTADITGLFSVPGVFKQLVQFPSIRLAAMPTASAETTYHLRVESVERFSGDVTKVRDELDAAAASDFVLIACHNDAEKKRLGDVLGQGKLAQADRLRLVTGHVHAGFRLIMDEREGEKGRRGERETETNGEQVSPSPLLPFSPSGLVVLGDHELFHRDQAAAALPRRRLESRAIDSFLELQEDDLVVHLSHGIARFRGMHVLEKNGQTEEHLILEFAGGTRVYVPASKIDLVQKYVGGAKTDPELSKLGGTSWQNKKDRVQAAVLDLASEMLELQAMRESKPGVSFPPDSDWQREFDAAFPYEETPDQLTTIAEIKRDMEKARPMDRLICGDVGYGKTELAMRAAFKAIDNGKQVAILVPTTVLAEQHFRTFSQRMAEYPFSVEVISRFRTGAEQRRIVQGLADGTIDVIIGTHRIVSKDVQFKELGLVIIDEEQRFGVEHKEKLKKLRQTVDVLTLTATPIPRTLHLSLLGIRDISNLETAPAGRLAIETRIVRFDRQLIRHAIMRELNREGQIYFVHNRVHNIHEVAGKLQEIVPEARIVVGHGQMGEHELEDAMVKFVQKQADILVATTIIESGLDIPNANTMFINQADIYGLADLHQLRGRVGRYKHRAYAYLLLDAERDITPNASRRLKAIEEFTELGAGFKIAMRDLEIRGAGNILGTQQSGHIAAVGYELYCHLLENAVRSLKNMPVKTHLEVTIDLPWVAMLPRDYVPGQKLKIEVYRRLSRIRKLEGLIDFRKELRDRYGPIPTPVEWLLRLAELRVLASHWQIAEIHLEGKWTISEPEALAKDSFANASGSESQPITAIGPVDLVLAYRHPRKLERLAKREGDRLRIVDAQSAYFRLRPEEHEPQALYERVKHLLRLPDRPL
ncbi:MAG: transcription-repair coupling factor [Planctomycetes bacterium]|nr:transcription-repair coupling factor [Planctomycetota bacterium]